MRFFTLLFAAAGKSDVLPFYPLKGGLLVTAGYPAEISEENLPVSISPYTAQLEREAGRLYDADRTGIISGTGTGSAVTHDISATDILGSSYFSTAWATDEDVIDLPVFSVDVYFLNPRDSLQSSVTVQLEFIDATSNKLWTSDGTVAAASHITSVDKDHVASAETSPAVVLTPAADGAGEAILGFVTRDGRGRVKWSPALVRALHHIKGDGTAPELINDIKVRVTVTATTGAAYRLQFASGVYKQGLIKQFGVLRHGPAWLSALQVPADKALVDHQLPATDKIDVTQLLQAIDEAEVGEGTLEQIKAALGNLFRG